MTKNIVKQRKNETKIQKNTTKKKPGKNKLFLTVKDYLWLTSFDSKSLVDRLAVRPLVIGIVKQ